MKRRFFLLAAPAIVAAPSLMRISAAVLDSLPRLRGAEYTVDWIEETAEYPAGLSGLLTETLRRNPHMINQSTKSNALLRHLQANNLVGGTNSWTYYGRPGAKLYVPPLVTKA